MSRSSPLHAALLAIAAIATLAAAPSARAVDVRLCTDRGAIDISLDERNAPLHTANFMHYVDSGFYTGTVLHRVVAGSMVQGGAYDLNLERRRPDEPVADESHNGLSNRRGTIAASRGDDPDSATSQFFFNLSDNGYLDATRDAPGFTVFGRVTAGLEVLDEIARLPTRRAGNLPDVPMPLVEVDSIMPLERAQFFGLSVEDDPASLQTAFDAARQGGDAAATLAAIDDLRRGCIELSSAQHVAEAEAAIELGHYDRARYGLAQYLAKANALDPNLARAQNLYSSLPARPETSNIDELMAQCRRPVAPSIPEGGESDLQTMQSVEGEVRRFRQLGQLYLSCVRNLLDRGGLNEPETVTATERHNDMVVELTAVATRFNNAVRAYKATQESGFNEGNRNEGFE